LVVRGAHFLFELLQGAYNTHAERAQMRLAPVKSRSWREIQMSMRQSDVRFDDFKQELDHVDNRAAELVPGCRVTTRRGSDKKLPPCRILLPVVVDGRSLRHVPFQCSEKSLRAHSRPSGIVACPVCLREHVGNELCIPSVMC
jgi:ribosomal protein L34E